jgi:TfoX/Sxy family transcriptional regulator of competence genes
VEIPKPSEEDKQFFRSLIEPDPEVEIKPMFGNLGAFVHGNMFAGLFGSAVGVRLGQADAGELAAIDGSGPFGPAERPMGGYLSLPGTWRDDADLAARWVEKAQAYVGSLPPKAPKAAKPGKGRASAG